LIVLDFREGPVRRRKGGEEKKRRRPQLDFLYFQAKGLTRKKTTIRGTFNRRKTDGDVSGQARRRSIGTASRRRDRTGECGRGHGKSEEKNVFRT